MILLHSAKFWMSTKSHNIVTWHKAAFYLKAQRIFPSLLTLQFKFIKESDKKPSLPYKIALYNPWFVKVFAYLKVSKSRKQFRVSSNSSKKRTKTIHQRTVRWAKQKEFVRSFFGRIVGLKKHYDFVWPLVRQHTWKK